MRRKDFVQRNKDAILSLLSPGSVQGRSRHQDHTIESEEWADEARKELTVALFTHDELCKERLKLNMALVCSVSISLSISRPIFSSIINIVTISGRRVQEPVPSVKRAYPCLKSIDCV